MSKGFTLFELIVVIILVGILSAYALPRLNLNIFRETGFDQQAIQTIRFAQKRAIMSGCSVNVSINSSTCSLSYAGVPAGCPSSGLDNPATGNANFCLDSQASGSPAASFSFDRIGTPSAGQTISTGTSTIIVVAETGFVYAQ